jgi:predicted RNA-binding protein with PUA-like domain
MNYWLVKQEPEAFSWDDFVKANVAVWDGVRNYAARNNLKAMALGDRVLYYHSVTGKCVVGIAEVSKEAYPDPTDDTGKWVAVELIPLQPLHVPVKLEDIKKDSVLVETPLVRIPRLSVMPLTPEQYHRILELGQTKPV